MGRGPLGSSLAGSGCTTGEVVPSPSPSVATSVEAAAAPDSPVSPAYNTKKTFQQCPLSTLCVLTLCEVEVSLSTSITSVSPAMSPFLSGPPTPVAPVDGGGGGGPSRWVGGGNPGSRWGGGPLFIMEGPGGKPWLNGGRPGGNMGGVDISGGRGPPGEWAG